MLPNLQNYFLTFPGYHFSSSAKTILKTLLLRPKVRSWGFGSVLFYYYYFYWCKGLSAHALLFMNARLVWAVCRKQSTCWLFLLKPKSISIRGEFTFRNLPITRHSNPLNATMNVMLMRSFWQSCLHIAWWWVSACRLATAQASMFDREKNNGSSLHMRWHNYM